MASKRDQFQPFDASKVIVSGQQRHCMADGEGGDPDVIERDHGSLGFQTCINFRVSDGCAFVDAQNQASGSHVANPQMFFLGVVALVQAAIKLTQHGDGHPYFLRLIESGCSRFVSTEQADYRTGVDGDVTSLDDPIRCVHCYR